jgi:acyl-CoA synthetase (AMP-forming)/AMP-acid ligase II
MESTFFDRVVGMARDLGEDRGIHMFMGRGQGFRFISYRGFLGAATRLGSHWDLDRPDRREVILIGYRHPFAALIAFFAALSRGCIPLILPSPKTAGGMNEFGAGLRAWVDRFGGRCKVALEEGISVPNLLREGAEPFSIPGEPDCGPDTPDGNLPRIPLPYCGSDTAFLQCTSATTGKGKLVSISNGNLISNLEAIRSAVQAGDGERVASWLPLYHDMGLVGTTLFSFFHGYALCLMGPYDFLKQPMIWIKALSDFRCTLTAAPNFGFDYAARNIAEKDLAGIDLAALKGAFIGAEPIRFDTVKGFIEKFSPCGLPPSSILPCYGLAEATLAVCVDSPARPSKYVLVDARSLELGKPAGILSQGIVTAEKGNMAFYAGCVAFSEGRAVDGIKVDVVGEDGRPLAGAGWLGEIRLTGECVSAGYLDPETMAIEPFPQGYLLTGDLGFTLDGEVYVLERKKNIIIRNGRNFPCCFIEERVAEILNHSPHDVMVVETDLHADGRIVALVENYEGELRLPEEGRIRLSQLDVEINEIKCFQKRIIPRTTSGKKKYFTARKNLMEDRYAQTVSFQLTPGMDNPCH